MTDTVRTVKMTKTVKCVIGKAKGGQGALQNHQNHQNSPRLSSRLPPPYTQPPFSDSLRSFKSASASCLFEIPAPSMIGMQATCCSVADIGSEGYPWRVPSEQSRQLCLVLAKREIQTVTQPHERQR